MKFNQMPYERIDIDSFRQDFQRLLDELKAASSFAVQSTAVEAINKLRRKMESSREIAMIRHTIDTTNDFYKDEQDYLDETQPLYQGMVTEYYQVLLQSPFRAELEQQWGPQLFRTAKNMLRTFSPEVVSELQLENKLSSEYTKRVASAKILFEGEERTLPQLVPFMQSSDREVRKRAADAYYGFYADNGEELDRIYDELVKTRTSIAKQLGFDNFVGLAYARLNRTDYDAAMVQQFREQVKNHIVPIAKHLRERQAARIDVEQLRYFDRPFQFPSGNPEPHGSPEWIVDNGKRMYQELSPETDEFFAYMVENELMDLVSKPGKAGGGYCTYIGEYEAPFIFSNFNGTEGDIGVLTHEAGHAFQAYSSRNIPVPEYMFPTFDAAEIHSMSMEFFTWPWMQLFFEEETDKYKFMHLGDAVNFIPYSVSVDEFQHVVYENPEWTPAERKAAWRDIERKYLGIDDHGGNDFLEQGGYWQHQLHIYTSPFYYIDYTLAQLCALQFWAKAQKDHIDAWKDYVSLCRAGGSQSFVELVAFANLRSPFEEGAIAAILEPVKKWLADVDDRQF